MYVLDTLDGVSKRMAYYILDWCSFLPIVGGINSQSWLEKKYANKDGNSFWYYPNGLLGSAGKGEVASLSSWCKWWIIGAAAYQKRRGRIVEIVVTLFRPLLYRESPIND